MDYISQINSAENNFVYVMILVLPLDPVWRLKFTTSIAKRYGEARAQGYCKRGSGGQRK